MGRLAKDTKNLILGNDGSDKEPVDFKTELQKAIKEGLISKADGAILLTSRDNSDRLGELIYKTEEKEIIKAEKSKVFDSPEEEQNYYDEKEKEDNEKERLRKQQEQENSLAQEILNSQNQTRAKMKSEKSAEEKSTIIDRK